MSSSASSGKQAHSKRAMLGSVFNKITETTNINNLRQIQATYDPRQAPETLKLQLLIKAQKSLVVDSEGLARDSHMVSKQLYHWACDQPDLALKDVGDRLAYMNYQVGDIQQQCSQTLERSRSDLKDIRNLENELIKLREREKALQLQINKSQQDSRKKVDSTMIAEHENIVSKIKETEEKIPTEKRRLIKSSYTTQFEALREMGDKLMIIAHFGDLLLNELPEDDQIPYSAQDKTAQIKGAASLTLSDYHQTVHSTPINHPLSLSSSLHRSDTRLFGETHPHILTEGSNDSQGSGNIGSSTDIHHSSTRPSSNYSSVNQVINNQPAMIPSSSSQPPKLPNRPSTSFVQGSSSQAGGGFNEGSGEKKQGLLSMPMPSVDLPHDQPTVAEVGAHVPTTTNGPAHGILGAHPQDQEQPFDPNQPPAYSPIPADLKP
ncbi:hypothetical protein PSTG_03241 [Puccinia striiformis f. sp. tritici PST-78]|uniref:Sphingolipid long chain base-responsive protein LSP1 n=1 Tax=Puccinia striiformis f. sp. tritici PST-78 TaxID=1165861 RepID=A0A0L0VWM6_9BASI|nr:hypothetical protein PSTG_03241 [Puccinia striiformis f. sp. tritici PST-78]